jgi:uncharacterized membrane protein YedE/YeeE
MKPIHVRYGLLGLMFGVILSRTGFSDFGQVHEMFLFTDLRLFLTFGVAVAVGVIGFYFIGRRHELGERRIHPGTIWGSVMFGAGWAITGACPSIALAQLGEGKLPALVTLAGMFVGNWLYGWVHRKYFRWDPGTCAT